MIAEKKKNADVSELRSTNANCIVVDYLLATSANSSVLENVPSQIEQDR